MTSLQNVQDFQYKNVNSLLPFQRPARFYGQRRKQRFRQIRSWWAVFLWGYMAEKRLRRQDSGSSTGPLRYCNVSISSDDIPLSRYCRTRCSVSFPEIWNVSKRVSDSNICTCCSFCLICFQSRSWIALWKAGLLISEESSVTFGVFCGWGERCSEWAVIRI